MGDVVRDTAAGAAGGSVLGPVGAIVGGVGGMVSGIWGGGDQQQQTNYDRLTYVNPYQQAMVQQMQQQAMAGNMGDMGFGSAVKQGKGQIQGMMSRYGISPQSGVYQGAMSNMIGTAAAQQSQNAYENMLRTAQLQTQYTMAPGGVQGANLELANPSGQDPYASMGGSRGYYGQGKPVVPLYVPNTGGVSWS